MQISLYETLFERHNACVLIPTYNNAQVLEGFLKDLLNYTSRIIIVNDGSTDDTESIVKQFAPIHLISYKRNKGKGYALRTGLKEAARLGYDYVITIDSDGQHYPSDLKVFLEQLNETPHTLMVGARNMNQENVPGKSSFGNKFSNFWFWVNTGRSLPDTQSGYRLYPLKAVADKAYFTTKYEFEIEVMVRASWSGVKVISVPVSVYYPKPEERISHFRPFKDFTRISILNTFLVLIALLYIKPRDFIKLLFSREGWRTMWRAVFIHPNETNQTKAASLGFGVFMGIVPVWGFQLAIGIPLSILFRMNKALFLLAANISIFPFTPLIWIASLMTGKWVLGYKDWSFAIKDVSLQQFKEQGLAFFLGGTVLAIAAGLSTYLLSYSILFFTRKKKIIIQR